MPDRQRILVINPNSSEAVTRGIDAALAPVRFSDGPCIECATLSEGPPGIETQRHADQVIDPLCELIAREDNASDAFVIACFGDPGLHSARDVTAKPVFGIAQSAYLHALGIGERFGVIAILPASVVRQRRFVRQLGLDKHYAASLPVGLGVTALGGEETAARMVEVGAELVNEHDADVLILGCAGMAGYRQQVEDALGVPTVEPCQAAAARALASVRFGH